MREIAIFAIAVCFTRYHFWVFVDLLDISPTKVIDFDQARVKGQGFGVILINAWQAALLSEAFIEVSGDGIGEVERGEDGGVLFEEDVFGVLMQLIGALGIVSARVQLGLAGVIEGRVDALVEGGLRSEGQEQDERDCQDIFHGLYALYYDMTDGDMDWDGDHLMSFLRAMICFSCYCRLEDSTFARISLMNPFLR